MVAMIICNATIICNDPNKNLSTKISICPGKDAAVSNF